MQDLSYRQLFYLSEKIGPEIIGSTLSSFEEIHPYEWTLSFSSHLALLVCLQHPFVRFHLIQESYPTQPSPFCKKIEQILLHQKVSSFTLLNQDRILAISFENGYSLIFELFSRGSNLYLIDEEKKILFAYRPIEKKSYSPPPKRVPMTEEIVDPLFLSKIEEVYKNGEEKVFFEEEKKELLEKLLSRKKKLEKEIEKLEKNIVSYKKKSEEAILLKNHAHLLEKGKKEIEIEEDSSLRKRKILLNPSLSAWQQIDAFFKKVEQLKKEASHSLQKIDHGKKTLLEYQKFLEEIEKASSPQELLSLKEKLSFLFPPKITKRKEFLHFYSLSGFSIFVGRNDRENDALSFSFAHGSDLWFHAADFPGSHVIVKKERGKEIDAETLLDAASLALFYSKGKDQLEGDVFVAEKKFLSRVKGKLGQVHMAKHKKIKVLLDPSRIERIKKYSASLL